MSVDMLRLRVTSDCQPRRKKGPAGPEHDRCRKDQLHPIRGLPRHKTVEPGQVPPHLQRDHRERQREADPEPARHIDQLMVRPRLSAHEHGFERHATDRARTGADLRISGCIGQV